MKLFWLIAIPLCISANFIDSDLDGVEDSKDLCPNTDIFAIVDKNGCSVKKLTTKSNKFNYFLSLSYLYLDDTDTQNSYSLNFLASYSNYSLYIDTTRYNIDGDIGLNDITIALFYNYTNTLKYTVGLGLYLPADNTDENKLDYFFKFKVSYSYKDFDSYISYQRTINRDIDTKDSSSYGIGIGYNFSEDLYYSISYLDTQSSSINSDDSSKYLSLYTNYYFRDKRYISLSYSRGLNSYSTKNSYYITVGFDF